MNFYTPAIVSKYRVAIIGDFTSGDKDELPLSGASYYVLEACLNKVGLSKTQCMLASIGSGTELSVQASRELKHCFEEYRPNLIICLGDRVAKSLGVNAPLPMFRGSVIVCKDAYSPAYNIKCLVTYHPREINKMYEWMPLFLFDLQRARRESEYKELRVQERTYLTTLTTDEIVEACHAIPDGSVISLDIEGGLAHMSCVSIATSPHHAFCITLPNDLHTEDKIKRLLALNHVCSNPNIGKILQNCLYDNYVLFVAHKIWLKNVVHDTMLSGWEIYPELPKGLGTQVSIWTDEPAYKFERKQDSLDTLYTYCCKDACYTFELALKHREVMGDDALEHFSFNMSMLPIALYMGLKGMRYKSTDAAAALIEVQSKCDLIETKIATLLGSKTCPNLGSPKQVCEMFYTTMGLPKQHPKLKSGRGFDKSKLTADTNARLSLITKTNNQVVKLVHLWATLNKQRTSYLAAKTGSDGRMHASYNVVGTKTGRFACTKALTGDGLNLTTVPKKYRSFYIADTGNYYFQLDLSGADGWTVAARCADRGDSTMLDDYRAGIKPAKVIALCMTEGRQIADLPTDELLIRCKEIDEEGPNGWIYFTSKRVQHGTNYLLGVNTMSMQILKDSDKVLNKIIQVKPSECQTLQNHYLYRYWGVPSWHKDVESQIRNKGTMRAACGHHHRFFGRPNDNKTLREALAFEPQCNTTYITNKAALNLWNDPENRQNSRLIIQPLHQVHDALCGQFPIAKADWAIEKLNQYFQNPIQIGSHLIIIPFDGGFGKSWGELNNPIKFS